MVLPEEFSDGVVNDAASIPVSYSIANRSRFRVSVECENSTMEDGPGLAPVLPVLQINQRLKQRTWNVHIFCVSPDLFSSFCYFGLVKDSCFLQQVALKEHKRGGRFAGEI